MLFCKEKKIEWFASAWDCKSQEFLQKYEMPYNKIASAMLTNKEAIAMLKTVAKLRKEAGYRNATS